MTRTRRLWLQGMAVALMGAARVVAPANAGAAEVKPFIPCTICLSPGQGGCPMLGDQIGVCEAACSTTFVTCTYGGDDMCGQDEYELKCDGGYVE